MSKLRWLEHDDSDIPTPAAAGQAYRYMSTTQQQARQKGSDGLVRQLALPIFDVYANRPAAVDYIGYFVATDIGNGCKFYSDGSAWLQSEMCLLNANSSIINMNTAAAYSIFDVAPSLPNGCLAVGSFFKAEYDAMTSGGGAASATLQHKIKVGSTTIGEHAAWDLDGVAWNPYTAWFRGMLSICALGSSGAAMATGRFDVDNNRSINYKAIRGLLSAGSPSNTQTTVNTTGTITVDFTVTIASPVNSASLDVSNAFMWCGGLV